MNNKIKYQFAAKLWRDNPENGWYFLTLPKEISKEIRSNLQFQEEGWGRMKTVATINDLTWKTSIWFDSKAKSYLLPVKGEVRKKLSLKEEDVLEVCIFV